MAKVTVVIPNYNGKVFLNDCLKSLRKQTFKDFDIIMVDNGSSDDSISFVKKNYEEVQVMDLHENTGFAHAVNEGIKASSGEFVFLLNNDTICDERAIEALYKAMNSKKMLFSAQAKMLQVKEPHNIDDSGDLYCALGWAFSPGRDKDNKYYSHREAVTSACAGAAMYRKAVFEEIGYFDDAHFCYLEDVDVGYRARLYGYINVCEPSSIVYHVGSASSGSRHNEFKVELTAANNLYLIYKVMPIYQLILNLPLILLGIIIKHAFYSSKGLGKAHVKGLLKGFSKIHKNSDKRVPFGRRQLLNSLKLQLELWINCARRVGVV
ncbi:glycosyltransferase family 2 protein [Butyrivibrio proteoclasticus]|uniref:glycosyltransferase family 2 protein n=1 Tax=Butyrivibrio proteoclasticus TaxID=43305 RepID=UPI00047C8460|nr:glycosyltransferase family 2 protein [Butyrivibrio proteoclasticus]